MSSSVVEPILVAAIAFTLSQISLSVLLLLKSARKMSLPEWLFLSFLVTVAAYMLTPLFGLNNYHNWYSLTRSIVEGFLPGVFWLFCSSLFIDRFKIKIWHIVAILITVSVPWLALPLDQNQTPVLKTGLQYVPQVLEFILLSMALLAILKHWRDDLIEERRDLRLWFCAITGVYIFGLIALREIILVDSAWFAIWQYLPVGFICLFTNLLLMQYRPDLLNITEQSEPQTTNSTATRSKTAEIDVPAEVVQQLDQLMNQDHVYREMGLTIGQLAERLELPEYRLRRIINAGLGFRNFNDYLNGFRIKEAGQRLADPSQNGEAILNIALDTGFRSLSSFNKAFRDVFNVTSTAYRQQQSTNNITDKSH